MAESPQDPRPLALAQEIDYLEEVWSCPPDARRMLADAMRLLRALPVSGDTPGTTEAARDEADREIADALVPVPVDDRFTDGPYVDVWGHLRTDRPT